MDSLLNPNLARKSHLSEAESMATGPQLRAAQMEAKLKLFTAAEIASCVATTPQNIRVMLKDFPPTGWKWVRGVKTRAWSFDSLPSSLIARLAKLADRHGFRTPLEFLQNAPRAREPLSLARFDRAAIERAEKLHRVLAPCLFNAPAKTSVAELARMAAPGYCREFGKDISDRALRELITRTLARDAGDRNFDRINLYFPERASKGKTKASPFAGRFRFDQLDDVFTTLQDRAYPTISEKDYCWREIVSFFGDRCAEGARESELKRALRKYILEAAPFLGATSEAVKISLNRKIRSVREGGIAAICDGRLRPRRSNAKPSDFEAMIKLLAQHTVFYCGGRYTQAYRELHCGTTHNGAQFSEQFRTAFRFDVCSAKSEVPKCVRNAIRPMVAAMKVHRLGPRAARLARPSIRRDWSAVLAGASYTSDDVTLNHYVYDWHEQGEYEFNGQRFNVFRPQFLPVVDERTSMPLGFCLTRRPTYNSWEIRTLMTRVCMREEIGLPYDRIVFERGIWLSRNVKGVSDWSTIDEGFARHGIRLAMKHATTPKAKVIEQVIGALQNLDEYAPGYIGRGEQLVKYERVDSFLKKLKRFGQSLKAEANPAEVLMSHEECSEMLSDVLTRFSNEPQNGERLQGRSPAEGWVELSGGRAHMVLPETLRYLLATAESVQTVTKEGIILRIGRMKHQYVGSARLGELIGEKVRVRYNPELPEQVVVSHIVSDPHAQQPFAVPLFERLPAHNASRDQFDRARAHQDRFIGYGKAAYRELIPRTSHPTICRSKIGSPELRAAGEANSRLERECIELKSERESQRREIKRLAAQQNLNIDPAKVLRPKNVVQHLQRAAELEAEIKAEEGLEASL